MVSIGDCFCGTWITEIEHQSFFKCMDCQSKWQYKCHKSSLQTPYIWILLNWQVISTAGWLEALCSYIASKHGAKSCTLVISINEDKEHLTLFHKGLQQVALALGSIPSLEHLQLLYRWYEYKVMDDPSHCSCDWSCKGLICDYTKVYNKSDIHSEAIVLQHVCQVTKFRSWPGLGQQLVTNFNEDFAKALQDHPLLTSFEFYYQPHQKTIHEALLSIPMLSKVSTCLSFFAAETVGELVAKESMRELLISGYYDVATTNEWTAFCSALGRKSAKLTSLTLCFRKISSICELCAELGRALQTNESLETLRLLFPRLSYKSFSIFSLKHGAALAQALANHPQLHDLQIEMPCRLLPEDSRAWQELFCNGIAQMKSLRRLSLECIPIWTAPMVEALQQLVPSLSSLAIKVINTTKEWTEVASCVVYGRRLTTLSIRLNMFVQHDGEKQEYVELMEGVLAMNQAGRTYVLDDVLNKRRALVVLASVKDNLDCLYIHLQESPSFLNRNASMMRSIKKKCLIQSSHDV